MENMNRSAKDLQCAQLYNTHLSKCNSIGRILLTTSFVLILSLLGGLTASNEAQASSLAELFGDSGASSAHQKFLKVNEAFSVKPVQKGHHIEVALNITPKHYLYKDKLTLKLPDGVTATAFKFSHASESIDDPTFGKVDVFRQPVVMATAVLTNASGKPIEQNIKVTWQGCADAGLCYPPQTEVLAVSLPATEPNAPNNAIKSSASDKKNSTSQAQSQQILNTPKGLNQTTTSQTTDVISEVGSAQPAERDEQKAIVITEQASNTELAFDSEVNKVDGTNTVADVSDAMLAMTQSDGAGIIQSSDSFAQGVQSRQSSIFNRTGIVNEDPFGLAQHPWLALLLLFLAGLGLAFTPCVLPMLPIVSNIVARQHTPTAQKGLMLSGSYALGVAVAYGILGAVIAVFGQQLGIIGWLQNPVILLSFAAVFVLLALYMLDVIRIPVPNKLRQKTHTLSQTGDKYLGSSAGSFIAGLLSALVVSPCVSAPLFGALLAVSTIGNPLLGFAALFMLGFGLSAPLILLGVGQSNLMPRAGEWMNWIKQGFALLLFSVALLLIERVLLSPMMLMLWSLWFMVVAIWAWRWQGRGQLFTKPMAAVLAIWSAVSLVGAAAGSEDSWQPLAILTQQSASAQLMQAQAVQPMLDRFVLGQSSSKDGVSIDVDKTTSRLTATDLATVDGSSQSTEGASDLHLVTLESLIPVIENHDKVLVDLTAEWCIECRIMDKSLFINRPEALQQWQVVRLDVTETNADSARILAELRLFGPPALLYFVKGKLVEQQVGIIKRHQFETTLKQL